MMVLLKVWRWIKKALVWISKNLWKFLTAFFGGLAVILGISYIIKKRKGFSDLAEEKLNVLKAKLDRYDKVNKALEIENANDEENIKKLEEEKKEIEAEIDDIRGEVGGMSNEEILAEFRRIYG